MSSIVSPPYFGTELCLNIINTHGGPVHNAAAQVIGINDKPIPRLYAAGELGSFFGHLYQGGSNFPEALAFGRIAGRNAAAESF
jgi:succinate dehydrogenase/fumarate reductase flavoprotein subunit